MARGSRAKPRSPGLCYFRDRTGLEIDLLVDEARRLIPIEIKGGMTYDPSFANNLRTFRRLTPDVMGATVIYAGTLTPVSTDGVDFANFKDTARAIGEPR